MTDLIQNSIDNVIQNQPDEIFDSRPDGIYYVKTSFGRNQKVLTQEQRICAGIYYAFAPRFLNTRTAIS